jgi:hypothetical protein
MVASFHAVDVGSDQGIVGDRNSRPKLFHSEMRIEAMILRKPAAGIQRQQALQSLTL